ncbi:MAG: chorismate mutase [Lachnospiraceae bacterium]|nr:chorismate mutase [Lachnospiraceae bacterium]
MDDLKNLRDEISAIDKEMIELFEKRMHVASGIAAYKKEHGLTIRDESREEFLIRRNCSLITDKTIEEYYVAFQKNLMDISSSYQNRLNNGMNICYSGVEGAFAYIAAKRMFPSGKLTAYASFEEAYEAVERGEQDCAILPIENSYAGEVGNVMDLMYNGNLYVNQVLDVDIMQNLLAIDGSSIATIKKVVSHPQALAQCDSYIKKHGFETEVYSNTAMAAKYVKELNDPTVAAIASDETAAIYGLNILDAGINSQRSNTTRFASFSRAQNRPLSTGKSDNEHFILVFTVKNEAGALAQTLNIIGAHNFNMKNLRSRPMKNLMWNYFFYIEGEGNINTPDGRDMLTELNAICANLKLVGTYK